MFQSLIASKNPFQNPQNINNCCLNITNNNQKPLQHPQQHQRQLSSCCFFVDIEGVFIVEVVVVVDIEEVDVVAVDVEVVVFVVVYVDLMFLWSVDV